MSLTRNIAANYASQIYVTTVAIAIVPLYMRYMGPETYGLVGFFAMSQVWFQLLEMGLTATIARETARFHGGAVDALDYRRLLRAMQVIFYFVAALGGGAMFFSAKSIAEGWLNVQTLPSEQVEAALKLMAMTIAFRWISGLYRGCISGTERLVWLGSFNATIGTLRFVGVLPILIWVGYSPSIFFSYQLIIALVELAGLAYKSNSIAPKLFFGQTLGWTPASLIEPIRPVLKFSLSMAFASLVWVLVTQTDKLILSKLLPLSDYGYFTLAVIAANGVLMVSGPVSGALMPRMAKLQAQGDEVGLMTLYRKSTQLVAVIAIPACLTLAFFAEQVLWVWTGDIVTAKLTAPTLRLYALGNGFLAMSAFPYYLQFAKGDLEMHLRGNIIFIFVLVPSLIWTTYTFGVIGAGYAWLGSNALYFFFWLPLVHRRLENELHMKWLFIDVVPPLFVGCSLLGSIYFYLPILVGRLQTLGFIIFTVSFIILMSLFTNKLLVYAIKKLNNKSFKMS